VTQIKNLKKKPVALMLEDEKKHIIKLKKFV